MSKFLHDNDNVDDHDDGQRQRQGYITIPRVFSENSRPKNRFQSLKNPPHRVIHLSISFPIFNKAPMGTS